MFTPLHLTMLLHYHTSPVCYSPDDPAHRKSMAVREYREHLYERGLIKPITVKGGRIFDDPDRFSDVTVEQDNEGLYGTTARGEVLVKAMCALPLPEIVTEWRMPKD